MRFFSLPSTLIRRVLSQAIGRVVDTLLGKQAALIEDVEQDETGEHDDEQPAPTATSTAVNVPDGAAAAANVRLSGRM